MKPGRRESARASLSKCENSLLLLRAPRTNLESVVTQLVLPVLAVEPPREVLVVHDDRLLAGVLRQANLHRLGRQLLGLGVQDLVLDLRAVARELAELTRQTIDAVAG